MVWGLPVSVPSMPAVGLFVLAFGLLATAAWRLRARKASHSALAILVVPMLAGVLSSPAHAQVTVPHTFADGDLADAGAVNANFESLGDSVSVTVPNTFVNGTPADADEVNANFEALKVGAETCLANAAAAAAGNQAVCESAGGTWDGAFCAAAPCDATTNDAAVAEALCVGEGGSYDSNDNTCNGLITVSEGLQWAIYGARDGCTAGGGTWNAEIPECTPAPVYPHRCFRFALCGDDGWGMAGYTGETATSTGCDQSSESILEWASGIEVYGWSVLDNEPMAAFVIVELCSDD